uniref:NADH-ubiquinone oxidoreductase chain 2 n=1 Tax=Geocalamus acutus TaxID=261498 RepID=A1IGI3_GEOAC|nr:NADH dehydrogenase subunit 2 [Geocalamus acutus]
MTPYTTCLMISSVIIGTIIAAAANHWMLAWIGLELNTLAILPIMTNRHTPRTNEAATKYFLIQAAASSMLLFATTMNTYMTGQWDIAHMTTQPASTMLTLALMMKLGVAPLHAWLPEVMQGTTITLALTLATWQKLAPFALLYVAAPALHTPTMLTLALLSTIIGGWGGLNQTQLRKLMAFSSIANLGWIISMMTINPALALLALIIYIIMTTTTFTTMVPTNMKSLKDATTLWQALPAMTLTLFITLVSLGGLPPTTGFMPKWFILKELTFMNFTFLATSLAMTSLLSLMFYIRIMYLMTMIISPINPSMQMKWRLTPKPNTLLITTLPTTLLLLPLTPLLITN